MARGRFDDASPFPKVHATNNKWATFATRSGFLNNQPQIVVPRLSYFA